MNHTWTELDFIAGAPSLDFANTASWTEDGSLRRERVHSYANAVDWAVAAKVLPREMADVLRLLSEENAREAEVALGRLRRFRQDMVDVVVAVSAGTNSPPDAQDDLARWFREAQANASLRLVEGRFSFDVAKTASSLDLLLWILAQDALRVLTTANLGRLRRCEKDHCWWFFLDTSKNGRRRWCDMSACGNVTKARRYYAKHHPHAAA
jgi:predicted RNA-binding Zn ribbon-like protein